MMDPTAITFPKALGLAEFMGMDSPDIVAWLEGKGWLPPSMRPHPS